MLMTLIILMMFGIACLLGVSCSDNTPMRSDTKTQITRQNIRSLSREQIQEKLRILESSQLPPEPQIGAMCYAVAGHPSRAEYVCPKCGEKTLYSNNSAKFIARQLEACRREFKMLQGMPELSLTLDESSFCAHCKPEFRPHQLVLTVNYADGSSRTSTPISLDDLRILRSFMNGDALYETSSNGPRPLKNEIPRLRELLGVWSSK